MYAEMYRFSSLIKHQRWLLKRFNSIRFQKVTIRCINLSSVAQNPHEDFKVNNISLKNYLETIKNEYENFSTIKDKSISRKLQLETVIRIMNERDEIIKNMSSLKELENETDESLKELAKIELKEYLGALQEAETKLLSALMFDSPEDDTNAIVLEVNAGVGGQEAMLFAKELFDMYHNFCQFKGWQVEVAELTETELGGIRHGSLLVSGNSVFKFFKYEAGVHRVQRVPSTESGGRIHTSTVSVLALPQPSDIQINLQQKDLKIETKRATGAGGQHVNTTDSAVRITHNPTGISVECQVDRSQIKNRKIALTKLRALLYQKELNSQTAELNATKKSQVRTNFRNEKIRTYNYSQDRITDHRVQGNVHNLKSFLQGNNDLEELIVRIDEKYQLEKLLECVNKANTK